MGKAGEGSARETHAVAIQARRLHKTLGGNPILRGVDLDIPAGGVSVLVGPSGTGKSVFIKHVIGLLDPDHGEVRVGGRDVARLSRRELRGLRRDVGVMFQDGALFSSMNVYDNVAFPLRNHTDLPEAVVREVVHGQLGQVGLANAAGRYPHELSGGMRKRAGLARALALEPEIVLCDEPDSGLDPVRTALLGELLLGRHEDLGGTLVVVTHNIGLARLMASHVVVLWRGEVVAQGPADQVFGSDDPFVDQFLNGAVDGPLGMDA